MRRVTPFSICALLFTAILLPPTLTGCGARGADQAKGTAHSFLDAMDQGDRSAAEKTLTRKAREKMDGASTFFPGHRDNEKEASGGGYTLGEPEVKDDHATVPVTFTDADGDKNDARLRLRREEGQWRVYAMTFSTVPGGPQFNLDFEHPEGTVSEAFRTMGQGMGMLARGMMDGANAFQQGFEQGMKQNGATPSPTPDPTPTPEIEEVRPSP